jgi:hypothetical protein
MTRPEWPCSEARELQEIGQSTTLVCAVFFYVAEFATPGKIWEGLSASRILPELVSKAPSLYRRAYPMSWGQLSGITGGEAICGRLPTVARHCLAYAHHSAQPKSRCGFLNLYLQLWQRRVVSLLKNSTRFPHAGQDTSYTSSSVQ